MDTPSEAMAYDDMDHAPVNRQFVDDLLSFHLVTGEILDLGAGTARIPIELCRRDDAIRVVAAELSLAMLDVARINLEIAGLVERILLVHGDAKRLGFANERFTAVISNSLVHHLPDPLPALKRAVRMTAAGGTLFFRDLLRPSSVQDVERLVERYAGDESDHARQMFRQSLHAALSLDEVRQLIEPLGFPAVSVQASSDRHWTWAAHKLPATRL
jgi:ubiquinone/menaquinone biosynthesis C-methylase UbiE